MEVGSARLIAILTVSNLTRVVAAKRLMHHPIKYRDNTISIIAKRHNSISKSNPRTSTYSSSAGHVLHVHPSALAHGLLHCSSKPTFPFSITFQCFGPDVVDHLGIEALYQLVVSASWLHSS
jgi:hypothetical protein